MIAVLCLCWLVPFSQNVTDSLRNLITGNEDTTQIQILNELSWQLCCIDNDSAIAYARSSIYMAKKLNFEKGLAGAFKSIGVIYQNKGLYDSSILYSEKAIEIYEKYHLEKQSSSCLNNIGISHLYQSHWDQALEYFYQALSFKQDLNDRSGLVSVYNNIGIVYAYLHNLNKALEYYLKSIGSADSTTEKQRLANTLNNIGIIYQDSQEYDSAYYYITKAYGISKSTRNKKGIATALNNIGSLLFTQKKYHDAINYFHEALIIYSELDDLFGIVGINMLLGDAFQETKELQQAHDYYTDALDLARQIESDGQIAEALAGLSTVYEKMGDFDSSLKLYKEYKKTNDSLLAKDKQKHIVELREKYEAEQREQIIKRLNDEAVFQNYKIRTQKKWLLFSVLGLVAIIGFLVILILQRNQKRNAYHHLLRKDIENFKMDKHNRNFEESVHQTNNLSDNIYKQKDVEFVQEKYKSSGLEQSQKEEIHERILFVMEKTKLYLQSDLNIERLASEISTNKSYVSQIINEMEHQNFSSFLNNYRINEARHLLLDENYKNLTIESIAKEVGFKSKSAFNTSFKKVTGITPSFFIKNASI